MPNVTGHIRKKHDNQSNKSYFVQLFSKWIVEDEGRKKLLERFQCSDSIVVEKAMANYRNKKEIVFIGAGSYANVFRLRDGQKDNLIFKLIRLLPQTILTRITNSTVDMTTQYSEAYSEYQISSALSKLNTSVMHQKSVFSCQMFPAILKGYMTKGGLPVYFQTRGDEDDDEDEEDSDAWSVDETDEDESKPTKREPPAASEVRSESDKSDNNDAAGQYCDIFSAFNISGGLEPENLILVMEDCGESISDVRNDLSASAILSIVKQIITGFMIAEVVFEFEHRDLHSGNVLVQKIAHHYVNYMYRGRRISIPSYGYRVKIIDTTFSRIRIQHKVFHKDLSHLFDENDMHMTEAEMKAKHMSMQDITYMLMAQTVCEDWNSFHPRTNLVWVVYVIYKMLQATAFSEVDDASRSKNESSCSQNTANAITTVERKPGKKQQVKGAAASEAQTVYNILLRIRELATKCHNMQALFNQIQRDPKLNNTVRISFK